MAGKHVDSTIEPVSMREIQLAHVRIREHVHRTPVMTSAVLDELAGASLFFKCENLQKGGAFKARAVFLACDNCVGQPGASPSPSVTASVSPTKSTSRNPAP